MLEFFRRYIVNKYVLAVTGAILMVLFLLPAGGQVLMPSGEGDPVGSFDGQTVTVGQQRTAAAEVQILNQLGMRIPDDPLAWILARHEAQRHGIYASPTEAEQTVDQFLEQNPQIGQFLQQRDVPRPLLEQAVRHYLMYAELRSMMEGWAAPPSEPRLRHFAQSMMSRATVEAVPVDAEHFIDMVGEPTEEQLQELFERYRDQAPGQSEPYGFGYLLPDRVKLAYLAVPLKRVAGTVEVDEVEAHRYYLEHPEQFMPEEGQQAEGTGEASGGAEEPLPYQQVRERVIQEVRHNKAEEKQRRIVQWVTARLRENTRNLPKTTAGYFDLSSSQAANWQPLDLAALAERVDEQFGVLLDVRRIENRWLSLSEVGQMPGFGEATLQVSGRPLPVSRYIQAARELEPEEGELLPSVRLQTQIASEPVRADDTTYIFRLLDASPAHAPQSLEEVRDQVVADYKRREAYKLLTERRGELLNRAKAEGLSPLAESFETEVTTIGPFSGRDQMAMMFQGQGSQVPDLNVVGRSEQFIREVFDLASRVRQAGGVSAAPAEEKLAAIPVDGKQMLVVVRLTDYQPVNEQQFRGMKPRLPSFIAMASGASGAGGADPLSREALVDRLGFEYAEPEQRSQEQEGAPRNPSTLR